MLMAPVGEPKGPSRGLDLTGDGKNDTVGYDTTGMEKLRLLVCQAAIGSNATVVGRKCAGDGKIDALDTNKDGRIDSRIVKLPENVKVNKAPK